MTATLDPAELIARCMADAASDWLDHVTEEHTHGIECANWEPYAEDAALAIATIASYSEPPAPAETVTVDALLDTRPGILLASGSWNEGFQAAMYAKNREQVYGEPWVKPENPYTPTLVRMIRESHVKRETP